MTDIYCGNNSLSKELTSKKKRRGTRFECFRKGVGLGLAQPLDKSYLSKYKAIDKRKMYCGKARSLPDGYSIMGSSSMCLQHGVGIGKKLKAKRSKSRRKSKVKSRKKSKVKSRRKSKVKSKVKSRRKSKVKSRKKSKVKSRRKSKRKSKVKSRRKPKVKSRKISNMRPPPNNFCFDDRMNELTRFLGNKYVINCLEEQGGGSVQRTIIIKSRYDVMIAKIIGLFDNDDQESFISWIEVNPTYRGRMFAQYLILLFAKLSSLYGKTAITLEDDTDNARGYRENRTTRGQGENSIRPQGYPLRDLSNIYLKMGFRYKDDDDNEMIVDVNHILTKQGLILSKFMERN